MLWRARGSLLLRLRVGLLCASNRRLRALLAVAVGSVVVEAKPWLCETAERSGAGTCSSEMVINATLQHGGGDVSEACVSLLSLDWAARTCHAEGDVLFCSSALTRTPPSTARASVRSSSRSRSRIEDTAKCSCSAGPATPCHRPSSACRFMLRSTTCNLATRNGHGKHADEVAHQRVYGIVDCIYARALQELQRAFVWSSHSVEHWPRSSVQKRRCVRCTPPA